VIEDVLRKMLVVDYKQRIDWDELFNHEVNHFLEEKIMKELEYTMNNMNEMNASRFYIKNNKVIDHVADIEKRADINEFTYDATQKKGNTQSFKGEIVKRKVIRDTTVSDGHT
jgi:serine/threonine-protein kinase ULK2